MTLKSFVFFNQLLAKKMTKLDFWCVFFQNQIFSKSGKYVLALNVLSLKEIVLRYVHQKQSIFSFF